MEVKQVKEWTEGNYNHVLQCAVMQKLNETGEEAAVLILRFARMAFLSYFHFQGKQVETTNYLPHSCRDRACNLT